jgi:hypothetical protein
VSLVQLALHVSDIAAAVELYSKLFGSEPAGIAGICMDWQRNVGR